MNWPAIEYGTLEWKPAVSVQLNKRQRAWRSPEVLELLDEFAALGGRRG